MAEQKAVYSLVEEQRRTWVADTTRSLGFEPGERVIVRIDDDRTWRGALLSANAAGLWLRDAESYLNSEFCKHLNHRLFLPWGAIVAIEAADG